MAAKYPATLATADDWTSTNAGMGRTKSNDKGVVDLDKNAAAEEFNQARLEIIAAQTKMGITGHEPVGTAGSLDRTFDFLLKHWMPRLDEPGFVEPFLHNTAFLGAGRHSPYMTLFAGAASDGLNYANADALAVAYAQAAAATTTGWSAPLSGTILYHQRSTYMATRLRMSALPATNGDLFFVGLYHDATHYVYFTSVRAGGAWPNWTVEVNNGGATWSDTLTAGNPADIDSSGAGGWVTFEILTTSSGAYFYYNRGETNAEYKGPGTQAPEDARAEARIFFQSNVGAEFINNSGTCVKDTRSLFGP